MSFAADMDAYFRRTTKKLDEVSYNATVLMFSTIVYNTPVEKGQLRGNWQASVDEGVYISLDRADPSGELAIADIKQSVLPSSKNILTNNLAYAEVIEYGLYPNPPKEPTGKSLDGFSVQAPFGIISPTLLQWNSIVEEAVRMIG